MIVWLIQFEQIIASRMPITFVIKSVMITLKMKTKLTYFSIIFKRFPFIDLQVYV